MSADYPADTTAPSDAVLPQSPADAPASPVPAEEAGPTARRERVWLYATQTQRSIARWRSAHINDKARAGTRA